MSSRPAARAGNVELFEQCERKTRQLLASVTSARCARDDAALPGWFVRADLRDSDRDSIVGAFSLQTVCLARDTHPAKRLAHSGRLRLSFPISYFRYWYLLPMRTYVLAYLEAFDVCLYADATSLVDTLWGPRIFSVDSYSAILEFAEVAEPSSIESFARTGGLQPTAGRRLGRGRAPALGSSDYALMESIASGRGRGADVRATLLPASIPRSVELRFETRERGPSNPCEPVRVDVLDLAQGLTFSMLYPFLHFAPIAEPPLDGACVTPEREAIGQSARQYPSDSLQQGLAVRLSSVGRKLFAASSLWRSLDLWPLMIEPLRHSYARQIGDQFFLRGA